MTIDALAPAWKEWTSKSRPVGVLEGLVYAKGSLCYGFIFKFENGEYMAICESANGNTVGFVGELEVCKRLISEAQREGELNPRLHPDYVASTLQEQHSTVQ
jgi:hypothetical protein